MKTIDPNTLAQKLTERQHRVILVDVRDAAKFKQGHIPGALNVTIDRLASTMKSIAEKDDMIVTYCGGGTRAPRAYHFLQTLGYENTICMPEGFRGWRKVKEIC
ncbi:MAG: rhodanese-like domain-containing protein [Patescibacteria group bacterium]